MVNQEGLDYISLSDIAKGQEGTDQIKNWMRSRNQLELLGYWEVMHNPKFNTEEFERFRAQAGSNSFTMTPTKWVTATNAIGIYSKAGKYGGTYAHKDIALAFCTWLDPLINLIVLKEFQRLKELEQEQGQWDIKRFMAKSNYRIQTDAIKEALIPTLQLPKAKEGLIYAKEADLVNVVMFGKTAAEWQVENPDLVLQGRNQRDMASLIELTVLSNIESKNADLILEKVPQVERFRILKETAARQIESLLRASKKEIKNVESPYKLLSKISKNTSESNTEGKE